MCSVTCPVLSGVFGYREFCASRWLGKALKLLTILGKIHSEDLWSCTRTDWYPSVYQNCLPVGKTELISIKKLLKRWSDLYLYRLPLEGVCVCAFDIPGINLFMWENFPPILLSKISCSKVLFLSLTSIILLDTSLQDRYFVLWKKYEIISDHMYKCVIEPCLNSSVCK